MTGFSASIVAFTPARLHFAPLSAPIDRMDVCVDQTWKHQFAAKIDHLRRRFRSSGVTSLSSPTATMVLPVKAIDCRIERAWSAV